jgi:AraC family transcriptional regulator
MEKRFTDPHDSFAAFYATAYPDVLVEMSSCRALGATLVTARQPAGDFSDAPTPDLFITRGVARNVPSTFDLGAGRFRTAMPRNSIVVTPPDTATTVLLDAPSVVEVLAFPYCELRALCVDHEIPGDGDFGVVHRSKIECPQFTAVFFATAQEIRVGNPNGRMFVEGAAMQLLSLLLAAGQRRLKTPQGGLAPWQLARVTDYLHENLDRQVSLADLAALVDRSVFHFSRAFRASTGMPPHRFMTTLKMERARLWLSTTDRSVTDVALSLGYESSQSFARAFRNVNGVSPRAWRRSPGAERDIS